MERIRQALERAREERAAASPKPAAHAAGIEVRYSRTRQVEVAWKALRERRVISGDDAEAIANVYKILRTRVLQRMVANGWNTIGITSVSEAEGKTLTAINLAISLSRERNHTVLLADLDLRRPTVHKYFGYDPPAGLGDFLMGEAELQDVLFNPGIERLVVLPGRKPLHNSSEMLSSPRMVQLIDELKSRYPNRLDLFDLPPALVTDDVLAFSPCVDALLLVIEEGKTTREALERLREILEGVHILGSVLNKSDEPSSQYYYY